MEQIGVLFDMDGLMLDTEPMARTAWTRALAEQGYHLDSANYMRLLGRTVTDARLILEELFGPDLPYQAISDLRQAYYDADIKENGVPIKPGLLGLLAYLEAHQIPKAVASSTAEWFARLKLARAGVEVRFQTIICGDMVANGKPAPDLFLEAARQINLPPERCVVLEDSEAGVLAAHTAGMVPLMIPDLKQPAPEIRKLAYRVMPSLSEVSPLLDRFLENGLPYTT